MISIKEEGGGRANKFKNITSAPLNLNTLLTIEVNILPIDKEIKNIVSNIMLHVQ